MKAFITGLTGQDGSYLADLLLEKGYEVAGLVRYNSTGNLGNAEHLKGRIKFYKGNLADYHSVEEAILDFEPDEIYNLGGVAQVGESFRHLVDSADLTGLGALRVFDVAKKLNKYKKVKVYQASSSEMYGAPKEFPQNESTPFIPNNPYATAKLLAHHNARILRESDEKLFISCGILFNHESERRGLQYVTRKISAGVACIKNKVKNPPLNEVGYPLINKDGKLEMGNLDSKRDWGYAPDYVEAMWMMLQQKNADDFVVATGENHSIKEFLELAFSHAGLNWEDHVVIDPKFVRPLETGPLLGDANKALNVLGWHPTISFEELVKRMVEADLKRFS